MKIYDLIANPSFKKKHILELLLIEKFQRQDKTDIIKNYDKELSDYFFEEIKTQYELHTIHQQPIEYILGYVKFFDRKFVVNKNTLIPRPETEYMIQAVVDYLKQCEYNVNIEKSEKKVQKKSFLLDIGTGSGVLGLSVFLETQKEVGNNIFEKIYMTDLSKDALEVAQKNFENLIQTKKDIFEFRQSNLLKNLQDIDFGGNDIVLVANLPYIPDETFDNEVEDNVKKREPKMAFVGGNDGLDLYRQMFEQLKTLSNFKKFISNGIKKEKTENIEGKNGKGSENTQSSLVCFLEMMTWQVDILRKEFGHIFKFEEVKTFHFNIRIVKMSVIIKYGLFCE